jgi:hypothetical protein
VSVRREMRGFAVGSLLFALGATPGYVGLVGVTADNVTYFLGSIFFTIAGFTQLRLTGRWRRGGWASKEAWDDWWAAAIQFVGTLAFNVSTFFAIAGNLDPGLFDNLVWRPDFVGSVCFIVASVLAARATTHRESLWDPEARNGWNTWINLAGALFFMVSAVFSWVNPSTGDPISTDMTNLGTFAGAVCFFVAALLLKPGNPGGRPSAAHPGPTANGRV